MRASFVSETGDIKIEFSRPIKIEFSEVSLRSLMTDDYWRKRRWLENVDQIYTAEEKELLSKIIKIEYKSSAEEGSETSQISKVKVSEASTTEI